MQLFRPNFSIATASPEHLVWKGRSSGNDRGSSECCMVKTVSATHLLGHTRCEIVVDLPLHVLLLSELHQQSILWQYSQEWSSLLPAWPELLTEVRSIQSLHHHHKGRLGYLELSPLCTQGICNKMTRCYPTPYPRCYLIAYCARYYLSLQSLLRGNWAYILSLTHRHN